MKMKIVASLAVAALLTGCGGANDHPKELLGVWKSECIYKNIETYVFDSNLSLTIDSYSEDNCIERQARLTFKFNALYDPELKVTSSGVEALKTSLTLASDITITPMSSDSLPEYEAVCPQENWAVNQETSIMACENELISAVIAPFETSLPMLFYIDGNNLYTSKIAAPQGDDGFPNDVSYGYYYIKQ